MSGRILKINAELAKAISEVLTYEIKNPLITGIITVTRVETTQDLDFAKVYVSIFSNSDTKEVFNQIQHSARFIRKEVASKLNLRKMPYLNFILDYGIEYTNKIENLLEKMNEEKKGL